MRNNNNRGGKLHSFFTTALLVVLSIVTIIGTLIITGFFFGFGLRVAYASGSSMLPTLKKETYEVELVYSKMNIDKNNIISFDYYCDPTNIHIKEEQRGTTISLAKRVVGLPGDTIECIKGIVYVNGVLEDSFPYGTTEKYHQDVIFSLVLGEDEYFVMGDNRENSLDSRYIGPIKRDWITGKYLFGIPLID